MSVHDERSNTDNNPCHLPKKSAEAETPPEAKETITAMPPQQVSPGQMLLQISSASLRNLYAAYVAANERGTFGGQTLQNQQLMMHAAMEAEQVIGQFDEAMVQLHAGEKQGATPPGNTD